MSILVGKPAPDFSEKAVVGQQILENFTLSQFLGKKYVILFFYPLDFTFVCPTELHAFNEAAAEFAKRNAQLIAVSTDSWYSHLAWLNTPAKQGGIQGVEYPIISDFNKRIASSYDVLLPEGMALRGLFVIDRHGIVQSQVVNNLPLGRSVDETLRILDAIQFHETYGEVCPANWNPSQKGMKATKEGVSDYLGGHH